MQRSRPMPRPGLRSRGLLGLHEAPLEPSDLRIEALGRVRCREQQQFEPESEAIERPTRRALGRDDTDTPDDESEAQPSAKAGRGERNQTRPRPVWT